MPKSDTITVSFRLPARLVAALDKIVKKRSPEIRDRTQLVELELTRVVNADEKKHD